MPIFEFEIINKRKGIVRIEAESKSKAKELAEKAFKSAKELAIKTFKSSKYLRIQESLEKIELLRTLEPETMDISEHKEVIGKKNTEIEKYIRYNFVNDNDKPVIPSSVPANDVTALIICANGIKARFREYKKYALYELL